MIVFRVVGKAKNYNLPCSKWCHNDPNVIHGLKYIKWLAECGLSVQFCVYTQHRLKNPLILKQLSCRCDGQKIFYAYYRELYVIIVKALLHLDNLSNWSTGFPIFPWGYLRELGQTKTNYKAWTLKYRNWQIMKLKRCSDIEFYETNDTSCPEGKFDRKNSNQIWTVYLVKEPEAEFGFQVKFRPLRK